jgi:hypothetical protein
MRQLLATEEHVQVPPALYSDPFYRITYLIKEEIRKHKWIEAEKGRALSWEQAREEWTNEHRTQFEKFLIDTLNIPTITAQEQLPSKNQDVLEAIGNPSALPYRPML